jgi:diguanylate cyclase (GGDEF)-like protein/hemerythrin-like metal-binding protein
VSGFLVSQLDYVYFVYGLALVMLASVAVSMSRDGAVPLPWGWLAASTLLHGLAEWRYLVARTLGESPAQLMGVTLVLLANYVLLFEFARRSDGVLRGVTRGRWLTGVLLAIALVPAVFLGNEGLQVSMRIAVALPASLWSAAVLLAAALRIKKADGTSCGSLAFAAACLAGYGLCAGIPVPAASFLPRGWPTANAFLEATGIPIQAVRAVLVSGAAMGVWAYAVSLDNLGRVAVKRWRHFAVAAVSMVVILSVGWALTERLGQIREAELAQDAEAIAAQVLDHLEMEMDTAADTARAVARLVSMAEPVTGTAGGSDPWAHEVVDAVVGNDHDRVVYLLDLTGRVIATSNRTRPDSFLGKSYAKRPYFLDALNGTPGRFVGVGMTSNQPGFYASEPLRDRAGKIVGVVAVKHVLSPASFGPLGTGTSFLVSREGKVVVTGAAAFQGRDLWANPSAPGAEGEAGSAPILDRAPVGIDWVRLGEDRHVAVRKQVAGTDWTTVVLKKETLRGSNRLLGILITLLVSAVVLAAFVILQRQLGTESRLTEKHQKAEGKAREMARKAETDALTGIPNRQAFNQVMARELARARRFLQPLSVVIVDIDHFKRVNDQYGHPVGDQVLKAMATLLATRVRESDFVARWGGEEFAVIASMTDAAGAARLAEKLRALLEVTNLGPAGSLTASFGVAELTAADTAESLLQRADGALYEAKEGGRNRVRCAESWVDMEVVALAESQGMGIPGENVTRIYMDTGYGPIDDEHRELSAGLDRFASLVNAGDVTGLRPVMAALVMGVAEHFAHEEELMRKHGYPGRGRHEEAHRSFVADATRYQGELERSGLSPEFRRWAGTRLPEWFRYHILAHDVALGRHLITVAARPAQGARRSPEVVGA